MQDASGSNSPLATTIILNLTTTSTSGAFYADSACATSPLPTVQIAAGDTDATIFYKDSAAATATLKVTDPASSGLGFAST
ncbi:hypothetical protein, partial [Acinetobacter sp. LH3_13]|uniref:hypothetical protein n=1 Tax=Acinetobacter sp. LH3_13 TaxID=3434463 RepID=UPI003EBCCFDD